MTFQHRYDRHPGARFMSLPLRRHQRATQTSATARTIPQRALVTLTLARHQAQPSAAAIVRLTACAVFAYLVALLVPETSPPVVAPLTSILVLQVSIFQTLFSALRRVRDPSAFGITVG